MHYATQLMLNGFEALNNGWDCGIIHQMLKKQRYILVWIDHIVVLIGHDQRFIRHFGKCTDKLYDVIG